MVVFVLAITVALFSVFWFTRAHAAFNAADAVVNPELTAAAKSAKRASDFLQWSYNLGGTGSGSSTGILDTLRVLWDSTFRLVLIIYVGLGIAVGFGYILKANWLDRYKRYIPWLVISLVAAAFSFVIAAFVIRITDNAISGIIQNSIAKPDSLINIPTDYSAFSQLLSSPKIDDVENVSNTITLLKSVKWTSYAIGGAFVLRTVILWMFVIFLPLIFPFIAFPITQSLGKVWLREFVRWLLYGLFVALFLYASNAIFTGLQQTTTTGSNYDQATNLQLTLPSGSGTGSTGTGVSTGSASAVTNAATYSQYLASLIMLWVSIVLPWLLLRYGISATSTATSKWYERNKTNPRIQSIIKSLTPPTRQGASTPGQAGTNEQTVQYPLTTLRSLSGKERSSVIAPAMPGEASAPIGQAPLTPRQELKLPSDLIRQAPQSPEVSRETLQTIREMSPANTLRAAGLTQLGIAASELQNSQSEGRPLQNLARFEMNPAQLAQISGDVNALQRPETAPSESQRRTIMEMKNNLLTNNISNKTKGLVALARNDVAPVASQSLTRELNEKNIQTVKEKTEKLLGSGQVTDQQTINQLESLTNIINQYQTMPSYKHGERHVLGDQIERAMRNITGTQGESQQTNQNRPQANAIPAASVNVKQDNELAKVDEGKELLDSMEVLSAGEVASKTSGGIDALLAQGNDIGQAVADKKVNDDFQKTKQQWLKFYKETPVPTSDTIKNRADWIREQVKDQEKALAQISTGDFEQKSKALHRLQKILPFLLMGNYSLLDITLYLKAKISAAYTILKEVEDEQNKQTEPQEAKAQAMPEVPQAYTPPVNNEHNS